MTISTGIRKAHRLGKHLMKMDTNSGICAFGATTNANHKNIADYPMRINAPCHAAYSYAFDREVGEIQYVVDMLYPSDLKRKVKLAWLHYILMESPFKGMFAERGVEAGFNRGYFFYTPEVDGNILTAGSVAVRMLSEVPEIPQAFYTLTKAGMHKDIAFLVAHFVTVNGHSLSLLPHSEEGHVAVVPTWMGKGEVDAFMRCDFDGQGIFQDERVYRDFNGMWGWGEYDEQREGNINTYFYRKWQKNLKGMNTGQDMRTAIFNHNWNRELEANGTSLDLHHALPMLNKISLEWLGV